MISLVEKDKCPPLIFNEERSEEFIEEAFGYSDSSIYIEELFNELVEQDKRQTSKAMKGEY